MLEQGPVEKRIIQQCMRNGQPLPAKIQNAPELLCGLEFYFVAFLELSGSRLIEGGSIPWKAVMEYAEYHELDDETADDLLFLLTAMDDARNNYLRKKSNDGQSGGVRASNQATRATN